MQRKLAGHGGRGFADGIGQGMNVASQPAVGLWGNRIC